jgi:tetratricopeptide (TPR) repeat protein
MRKALACAAAALLPACQTPPAGVEDLDRLNAASKALEQRRWDEAIRLISEAIQSEHLSPPRLAAAYRARGKARAEKRNYDLAIEDFSEALRRNPDHPQMYYSRGLMWSHKKEHDRAIADYTEALRLNPNYPKALNNRGNEWSAKGEHDSAIRDYNEAIRLSSDDPLPFTNRGHARAAKGDYERAILDYDESLRLRPSNANTIYSRGIALFQAGQFAAAANDLSRALQADPHNPYYLLWSHIAQRRAGNRVSHVLEIAESRIDVKRWPAPLLHLFMGRGEAVLAAESLVRMSDARRCEAHYYAAHYFLLEGLRERAKANLEAALQACPITHMLYPAARTELGRFGR